MSTWQYHDWVTLATPAQRLARLRLHVQEVSDRIASPQSVGSGSKNKTEHDMTAYRDSLMADLRRLESSGAGAPGSGVAYLRRARR